MLAVYAVSLVGRQCSARCSRPFFARLDTRTPLRNTFYGVLANLVLLPIFVLPFGLHNPMAIVGVALAYSLAQYVNVAHGWYRLSHEDGNPGRGLFSYTSKLLVASGISAGDDAGRLVRARPLQVDGPGGTCCSSRRSRAIVGLAVLAGAVMLLNGGLRGGELTAWRSALQRSPSPGGSSIGADPTAGTDTPADAQRSDQAPIDGVDIGESEDLESTAITANLP